MHFFFLWEIEHGVKGVPRNGTQYPWYPLPVPSTPSALGTPMYLR